MTDYTFWVYLATRANALHSYWQYVAFMAAAFFVVKFFYRVSMGVSYASLANSNRIKSYFEWLASAYPEMWITLKDKSDKEKFKYLGTLESIPEIYAGDVDRAVRMCVVYQTCLLSKGWFDWVVGLLFVSSVFGLVFIPNTKGSFTMLAAHGAVSAVGNSKFVDFSTDLAEYSYLYVSDKVGQASEVLSSVFPHKPGKTEEKSTAKTSETKGDVNTKVKEAKELVEQVQVVAEKANKILKQ